MNHPIMIWMLGFALATTAVSAGETIVIASSERSAASELAGYLSRIYPQTRFVTAGTLPASGNAILVGNDASVRSMIADADLSQPESYAVRSVRRGGRQLVVIAGADARGMVYGVYALLEKLGCGFHLSYDALPPARETAFNFDGWRLASRPLVHDRIVFDWHNFLSGCSTWNLADWNRWTDQSRKQGYNTIMVHAYGNNPMVSFTFNGKTKPVGYLSTTVKGRDWSTMHVNDVRQLFGGEVFQAPVFGADAAQAPDDQRAAAAQKLMHGVFAHAQQRNMEVCFADDVDTGSANPQELILTLPETARFATRTKAGGMTGVRGEGDRDFWLANPDTPEGYRYYKAQVEALMTAYPQITCLVVWFRNGGTPWMDLKVAEMPPAWQEEYKAAVAATADAAKLWRPHNLFAVGKIARAFDRALKELGHERVRLAAGTWHFDFLRSADLFMPRHVTLIGLDYSVLHDDSNLATAGHRHELAGVGARRPVIPVIWAHHDDGNYLGRSYRPFADFHAKLVEAKAAGFGVIHWTTRPLDLFFASHIRQTWRNTANEPLRATCGDMAAKSFGVPAGAAMGDYLEQWITGAPKFSRETSDLFIDRPLTNITEVITGCRERLQLIGRVDTAKLSPEQRGRLDYFKGLEEFIAAFYQTHEQFQNAQAALKKGDLAAARAAMAGCRPEPVIEQYAKFSSLGGITRGEQGSVVSLNTRWLPHIARLRQQLGLEAVRYNFGPTSHDPLAQAPGRFTFHFDAEHHLWQTLGEEETGAQTFAAPYAANEICRAGIESGQPILLPVTPILAGKKDAATVPAGDYRLRLLMLDPVSTAAGQRVFSIAMSVTGDPVMERLGFNPVKARFLRLACHGNSQNDWNSIEEIALDSLAKDAAGPVATASHEAKGFPASAAADGSRSTRWATRGRDEWIQFRLDPEMKTDHIGIAWFGGEGRKAQFEVQVSDDGRQWKQVENPRSAGFPAATRMMAERVDVFAGTGGARRVLERAFDVKLATPGRVTVTLTPVTGKALVCGASLEPVAAEPDVASLCPASLVSEGDVARLQRALARARRGEKVTIAVIGGSVTQGARASQAENRYGNLIAAWWRGKFPKARIEFVNAGIGATGSNFGALRARRDLLSHQPDVVVVEYSVNDAPLQASAETLEGLTRQILSQPNQPAAMLLFMMHQGGGNAQEWHAKVGRHYALPMVSFRDALWPEIKAGRLKWETFMSDQVHPNDAGHECAARFVIHLLEKVLKELPAENHLPSIAPAPAPLFTGLFEHTALFEACDLKPVKNDGWTLDEKGKCWRSDKPGSVIEFGIEGSTIYSMHFIIRKAMGKARARVDDCAPVTLNGWFDQTWGGYRCSTVLAKDLKPGPHRVRVELLEEKSPQSKGREFQILGLGAAGAR